jgi:hypothetical protein
MAIMGLMAAPRPVEDLTPGDRRPARPAAAIMAAEAAADRPVADHAAATVEEEGRAEALLPAAAMPRQATTDTNRFPPRFTHSSLTVRRLRKGPPALPEVARGSGSLIGSGTANDKHDQHDQAVDALAADDLYRI